MITSLLVANRGEIAVRIIRACRTMGIRAIAVHSEADADALHVALADQAICIGPAAVGESYLNIPRIIEAAQASGVGAIHPGYGMLSESPEFAAAVVAAGLVFVGPSAEAIARMGDKTAARALAQAAGLPVLPGSDGVVAEGDDAAAIAETVGYPVLVKASFGGGGRGMRIVREAAALPAALAAARAEAKAAFGRPEVFIERFVDRPRHVEVQLIADAHGTVVSLGDRDCTVQRRHQKLLEEAPAPDLPDDLRARLAQASRELARSIGYCGAATVEFLYDRASGAAYFLEVNTRLQVEHGVSELISGRDLVVEQIRVASGLPLGFAQDDVVLHGHAIQARIAAEDPAENFRPAPGPVGAMRLPGGPGIRLDFGVQGGGTVPGHYDSMFGKIHAWAETRQAAADRLAVALAEFSTSGIPTTAPYLRSVLGRADYRAMAHDTGSVERDWPAEALPAPPTAEEIPMAAKETWIAFDTSEGRLDIAVPLPPTARAPRAEARQGGGRGGPASDGRSGSPARTMAPMDCTVTEIAVALGDLVDAGQPLVILEAMKMQMPMKAGMAGIVAELSVRAGQAVRGGELLVRIEPQAALAREGGPA